MPARAQSGRDLSTGADLTGITLSDLTRLYLNQLDRNVLYVVCTEVLADKRPVSIRTDGSMSRVAFTGIMAAHGFDVTTKEGILYVCPRRPVANSQPSVADASTVEDAAQVVPAGGDRIAGPDPVQAVVTPPTRRERLDATGATGYLPKIVNRNGSTATIIWPQEATWSCPTYIDPSDRTIDERCHQKHRRL